MKSPQRRRFFAVLFSHIAAGPPPPPPPAIVISSEVVSGTADPLDNNRLRIFQPTLGFLSAIGGKYGNNERGYPQVLNRCRHSKQSYRPDIPPCQGLKVYFGVVFGCNGGGGGRKNFLGPEKFFQVQAPQTELQARYSTMPGLESLFWRGIRLQRRQGEEKHFSGPEK